MSHNLSHYFFVISLFFLIGCETSIQENENNQLRDYVSEADESYRYEIIDTVLGPMQSDPYFHRDIKTFENYAFVVSENTGTNEGMQIIDLSSLPDSVSLASTYIYNDHIRSHNMSIDVSTGFAYVLGQNREGVRIIDINNSEDPQEIHYIFTGQIHDVFARNDTVYIAEGWRGTFSMYDSYSFPNFNLRVSSSKDMIK